MKTTYRVIICLVALLFFDACGVRRTQAYYDYKTKLIGTELDGSYTLRSWGRARNAADAYVQARKTAVYDIVFNGVEPATSNLRPLKPLLLEVNAKDKYAEYFDVFFADGGAYEKFSSIKEKRIFTSNYARTDAQIVCQTTICVFRAELKKQLIADHIINQE